MKRGEGDTSNSSSQSIIERKSRRAKWERVLYTKTNLPDNYCDKKEFLNQLRKNETVVHYTFFESVRGACMVMGHVNMIVLYFCIFEFVQMRRFTLEQLLIVALMLVIICARLYMCLHAKSLTLDRIIDHCRTSTTLLLFGYGFTPVIRTLTTSISTDTIYAISFGLFFCSLVFHDYGLDAPIVSTTFSANLSLAASVFLISRVETDQLAFCLLALSVCAFSFWPRLRNQIVRQPQYYNTHVVFLIVLVPLTIGLLSGLSTLLAIIHSALHVFLLLVCPALLVYMQRHKSTIHGPWDEANSCNESGTDEASDNSSHKRKKRVKNDEKSNGPQVRQDGWLIKKKKSGMEEKEEEWVELTKELREEEAERTKQEEAQIIGPQIPDYLLQKTDANIYEGKVDARNQKNMLKGEAAAMAAYVSQGKRIPRRGEIGLSSSEISEFEKVGYVMSGTRHKSMEATRLRKEDQILTAEEKRLLSNFSVEQRRNREDTVLNQFRDLIASKKSKN